MKKRYIRMSSLYVSQTVKKTHYAHVYIMQENMKNLSITQRIRRHTIREQNYTKVPNLTCMCFYVIRRYQIINFYKIKYIRYKNINFFQTPSNL